LEDRKILHNVDSVVSLNLEDSPDIKITNIEPANNDNADLDAIQDTDGTFVAEDSDDSRD
jgi:hypothetical protein